MDTKTRISNAERLGRWVGGMWRAGVRRERRLAGWLVVRGLPAGVAAALLWVVKLAVLGVLLYAAFWLTLLVVAVMAVAWATQRGDDAPADDYSFTTLDELRNTPGYDPNLYNDHSHERYEDN
ncbi:MULTISPECIES: DUF3742 family protein [Gammaproteobacteria]|jgi:hypothetical protein|uniref:DUF3742 family protein n=1 Tax=Coralloluteibacterium thermophilum TaxID=2707049 RepID=A0ABV9NM72_9GAMM|nr:MULTISPECIES: DUF3742 family protein [Gammaproteobacteria]MCW5592182.1 DUF3742 family protein [Burkholderiales bacterium]WJH55998.1 DUF3742 family protein [Pseudomonas guguanensis]